MENKKQTLIKFYDEALRNQQEETDKVFKAWIKAERNYDRGNGPYNIKSPDWEKKINGRTAVLRPFAEEFRKQSDRLSDLKDAGIADNVEVIK